MNVFKKGGKIWMQTNLTCFYAFKLLEVQIIGSHNLCAINLRAIIQNLLQKNIDHICTYSKIWGAKFEYPNICLTGSNLNNSDIIRIYSNIL